MKKKNILVITGGAGFIGSNLILFLLKKTNFKIISIDNYSSGSKKNHIINQRVKYIKSCTTKISDILKYKKKIFIQFFILESFQEYIKALLKCMNVLTQIQ